MASGRPAPSAGIGYEPPVRAAVSTDISPSQFWELLLPESQSMLLRSPAEPGFFSDSRPGISTSGDIPIVWVMNIGCGHHLLNFPATVSLKWQSRKSVHATPYPLDFSNELAHGRYVKCKITDPKASEYKRKAWIHL